MNAQKSSPCSDWITDLKSCGLSPIMDVVHEVEGDLYAHWERYFIEHYRRQGSRLLNTHIPRGQNVNYDQMYKAVIIGIIVADCYGLDIDHAYDKVIEINKDEIDLIFI